MFSIFGITFSIREDISATNCDCIRTRNHEQSAEEYSSFIRLHPGSTELAAFRGHLKCLEYCTAHNYTKDRGTSYRALRQGNWDCLLHCAENGYDMDEEIRLKLNAYLEIKQKVFLHHQQNDDESKSAETDDEIMYKLLM